MPTTYLVTSYRQDYYRICRERGWDPFQTRHIGSVTNALAAFPRGEDRVVTCEPYDPSVLDLLLRGSDVNPESLDIAMTELREQAIQATEGLASEVST